MPNSEPRFRPVTTDADIAALAALADTIWHECFADLLSLAQIDHMVEKFQSAPALTAAIRQEGYEYFLIYFEGATDDAPGGYIGIHADAGKLLLSKLYLLAQHRGKGYTHTIMNYVEKAARKRSCDAVWLTVNRYNKRAIAVYRKTGFDMVREQVLDIGGGYVMDDFVFEKPL
ncbi:MAG: GNAT family N-acetyltransferase [Ruminococcaceae bacterium]|nr:GNAT family N-acetyltransferase [Oscillospiraceae bacterium]